MTIDLSPLDGAKRLLFAIPLRPLQGLRFQPTGFPSLGAATFRSSRGESLLVESAQSMANRLERAIWDEAANDVIADAKGISHVRVNRSDGSFLTDTILEAHRLNSPYLLAGKNGLFMQQIKQELGGLETGPVDRKRLAELLLRRDVGSLVHGVFLAKKELAGGRLRVARALTAFIEADNARVAASGGVKNDHVNPSGDTKLGFGNVPFARDEFTADQITLYVNLDLSQLRGYGLGDSATRLMTLLSLYKLRALIDGGMRLRTACDLVPETEQFAATSPGNFTLPGLAPLQQALRGAIQENGQVMEVSTAVFADALSEHASPATADEASNDADSQAS